MKMAIAQISWLLWIVLIRLSSVVGVSNHSPPHDNLGTIINTTNLEIKNNTEFSKPHPVETSSIVNETKEKRTEIDAKEIRNVEPSGTPNPDLTTDSPTMPSTLAHMLKIDEKFTQMEPISTSGNVILKKLWKEQEDATHETTLQEASTTSCATENVELRLETSLKAEVALTEDEATEENLSQEAESYNASTKQTIPSMDVPLNETILTENKTENKTNIFEEQERSSSGRELVNCSLSELEQTSLLIGGEEQAMESDATPVIDHNLVNASNVSCIISNDTQFSWLVKLVDKETKKQVCTGVLITDEDVLTPASCFLENTSLDYTDGALIKLPKELLAIAGGGINTDCLQVRNISLIYPHKAYFKDSANHDFAFVKASPPFDVDDDNIPDLRYHLNVINSEGSLVNIHNNEPFCESPYFLDDGINAHVSEERHLLGMRIDDCMLQWNCSTDFQTCLNFLHPSSHACLKPLTPRNCSNRDRGAPLICDDVFLGYLDLCKGELPMIFHGLSKAILFLELEDDHVQTPYFRGLPR